MNLLEHYITCIYSETEGKEYHPYILVDFEDNCYGDIKRRQRLFSRNEWDKIKEKGYYMG